MCNSCPMHITMCEICLVIGLEKSGPANKLCVLIGMIQTTPRGGHGVKVGTTKQLGHGIEYCTPESYYPQCSVQRMCASCK